MSRRKTLHIRAVMFDPTRPRNVHISRAGRLPTSHEHRVLLDQRSFLSPALPTMREHRHLELGGACVCPPHVCECASMDEVLRLPLQLAGERARRSGERSPSADEDSSKSGNESHQVTFHHAK